jgi:sialate O-acetylesterase
LRLAMTANGLVYQSKSEYSGPLYRQATQESGGMRIWFDHAAGLRVTAASHGDSVAPITSVQGFEVAGGDHKFVPAHATIDGETVFVSSPTVSRPLYVRYAWANESTGGLYNESGLPASTFTSE